MVWCCCGCGCFFSLPFHFLKCVPFCHFYPYNPNFTIRVLPCPSIVQVLLWIQATNFRLSVDLIYLNKQQLPRCQFKMSSDLHRILTAPTAPTAIAARDHMNVIEGVILNALFQNDRAGDSCCMKNRVVEVLDEHFPDFFDRIPNELDFLYFGRKTFQRQARLMNYAFNFSSIGAELLASVRFERCTTATTTPTIRQHGTVPHATRNSFYTSWKAGS